MNTPISSIRGLLGAIAGDAIGSVYEFSAPKHTHFRLFTPDSKWTSLGKFAAACQASYGMWLKRSGINIVNKP